MKYRCIVQSPEAVVQLIAASYLRHGYYWYVTGYIPIDKTPEMVDQKLIQKYGIDISEWERSRRRKNGLANCQLVRYDRWFIILLTAGHHPMRSSIRDGGEGENIKDCRRNPITFAGYSISYRRSGLHPIVGTRVTWHAHVRIALRTYNAIKAHFLYMANHRDAEALTSAFRSLDYARFAPVRRQLLCLLRAVNRCRSKHGWDALPHTVLNLRRTPVKVYVEPYIEEKEQSIVESSTAQESR